MGRVVVRLVFLVAFVVAAAACANPTPTPVPTAVRPSIPPLPSQAADAPILVQGRLLDQSGAPIAGGEVTLDALDPADDGSDPAFVPAYRAVGTTGADGSFEFRVAPTPGLIALAERNDGWVNFRLRSPAVAPSPSEQADASFSRQIVDGDWTATPETIQLQVGGD
jgi:hypothetical protein